MLTLWSISNEAGIADETERYPARNTVTGQDVLNPGMSGLLHVPKPLNAKSYRVAGEVIEPAADDRHVGQIVLVRFSSPFQVHAWPKQAYFLNCLSVRLLQPIGPSFANCCRDDDRPVV